MAQKISARATLSFDLPPPAKHRKLKSPFTPTRSAADIIGATQADDDFERDSLGLQSSCSTARIRLQVKFVIVATIYKDKCPPDKINERIRVIAFNAMAKSVVYVDIDPADRAFGGFKKKYVCSFYSLLLLMNGKWSHLFVCILKFAAISIHMQKESVCK